MGLTRTWWPGPGLEQYGRLRSGGLHPGSGERWRRWRRPPGEEVGGADQDPDFDAADGQRTGEGRDQRRGASVVDSAGEDEADVDRRARRGRGLQLTLATACSQRTKLDRGPTWPPHSRPSSTNRRAPSRRYWSSKPGEGACKIGGDAVALEPGGLVGPAAGDQGEGGLDLADDGELLGSQLRGNEAEDADSPGASAEQPRRLAQQAPDFCSRSNARARKGSPPSLRDRLGERRDVADAGHRSLEDRITRAVIDGQRRALGERARGARAQSPSTMLARRPGRSRRSSRTFATSRSANAAS